MPGRLKDRQTDRRTGGQRVALEWDVNMRVRERYRREEIRRGTLEEFFCSVQTSLSLLASVSLFKLPLPRSVMHHLLLTYKHTFRWERSLGSEALSLPLYKATRRKLKMFIRWKKRTEFRPLASRSTIWQISIERYWNWLLLLLCLLLFASENDAKTARGDGQTERMMYTSLPLYAIYTACSYIARAA